MHRRVWPPPDLLIEKHGRRPASPHPLFPASPSLLLRGLARSRLISTPLALLIAGEGHRGPHVLVGRYAPCSLWDGQDVANLYALRQPVKVCPMPKKQEGNIRLIKA